MREPIPDQVWKFQKGDHVLHVKTKGSYVIVGHGVDVTNGVVPVYVYQPLRSPDLEIPFVRAKAQFEDGRFVPIEKEA